MSRSLIDAALVRWGLQSARVRLAADRENVVYQVTHATGKFAMRFHRPGYRTDTELASELKWMAALVNAGANLPRPVTTKDGLYWIKLGNTAVDVLTWLEARPFAVNGVLNVPPDDLPAIVVALGRCLAGLHRHSDAWTPPADFDRPAWDEQNLLGESPLWGRFWDCPILSSDESDLLARARAMALSDLHHAHSELDYGLIHADAVPENVLVFGTEPSIIDFDDGGFGYRLFDLATTMNSLDCLDSTEELGRKFLNSYMSERSIDITYLPLFRLIRSLSYVGWVNERVDGFSRHPLRDKYVKEAVNRAGRYLDRIN